MQYSDVILFATYAGPPIIGAFIGYLTNRIAIRMLFRPLKAWHIFGLRVPMTPGVIPSKRAELAENMGEMVGEHLLTSTEIGTALSREPFQEHLHSLVDTRVQAVLKKELGPVSSFVPERFQSYFKVAVQTMKYRLGVGLGTFLASEKWQGQVHGFIIERLDAMGDKKINQLITPEARTTLYNVLESVVQNILASPDACSKLSAFIQRWLKAEADQGKTLKDQLPEQVLELLHAAIRKNTPALLEQLGRQLSEPFIRERIITGILGGVDHFIDSLGPMGAMARGMIDMDSLQSTVDVYLTDKEDDIIGWLQEPTLNDHLGGVLCKQLDAVLDRPLGDLLDQAGEGSVQGICDGLAEQVLAMFSAPGEGENSILQETIEGWCKQGELTFHALGDQIYGGEATGEIRELIARQSLDLLQSANIEKVLHILTDRAIDVLLERPVGTLHAVIPQGVQKAVTEYVVLTTNTMLLKEVPGLVGSLNISELVTEKVNSLDLLKLERLLLSIMEEQFKYINLFGALLGFLIGCINLLILRMV